MTEEGFILDPRDWITSPFTTCPFCGEEEFGLLMVVRRGYVKRCRACMKDESYDLPALQRKILYLDQFAISNLMKVLHPDHRHRIEQRGEAEERFWLDLFDQIERLVKLQALVCPWSRTHWEESFVAAPFEQLRRIYEHLAGDVRLQSASYVKHGQVFHEFEQWLDAGSGRGPVTRKMVVDGSIEDWMPKLQIHARLDPDPNTADELRAARAESHQGLASAVAAWREGPRRGFDAYFRSEVAGYGEAELRAYGGRLQKAVEISEGRREIDEDILFPTNSQILIERMKSKLAEQGIPHERQIETLYVFFRSEEMQRVPFLRIAAGMLAALAVKASLQQAPSPDRGMAADLNVVSTFLPYCDALFIDTRCAGLLTAADQELDLGYSAEIFTPASREELLGWLQSAQEAVPQDQRELVERVYGPSWLHPYRSIFEAGEATDPG